MTTEYRLCVRPDHPSACTHRWPMKSLEKAVASAQVYLDTATPYYYGSKVWIETRTVTNWTEIEDRRRR